MNDLNEIEKEANELSSQAAQNPAAGICMKSCLNG